MSSLVNVKQDRNIYLASDAVDFRLSINGLVAMFEDNMKNSAYDGSYFVFYNKNQDKIKVLFWDNNGFVLLYKAMDRSRFKVDKNLKELNANQLLNLLSGAKPVGVYE